MNNRDSVAWQPSTAGNRGAGLAMHAAEPINLKQISAFLAVVELRSITKAADRLHMSQSGLSRVVASLEAVIGERLFVRAPSGLSLSPTGSAFLPYAHKLHTCYCDAVAAARGDHGRENVLTVACTELLLCLVLPEFMALSKQRGPGGMPWRVVGMNSYQVVSEVESGRAEYGLCMNVGTSAALRSIPLLRAPLGLLTAPDMRLPAVIDSLATLNSLPMARLSDRNMLPGFLCDCEHQLDGYFNAPVVADTLPSLFAAVRAGEVATIVSGIAASLPHANGLRFVPLERLLPYIELRLVTRPNGLLALPQDESVAQFRKVLHRAPLCDAVKRL